MSLEATEPLRLEARIPANYCQRSTESLRWSNDGFWGHIRALWIPRILRHT
jgi:hypothetical protein